MEGRKFTREFKVEAVKLIREELEIAGSAAKLKGAI